MITGKILKLNGWPEGKVIGLAKEAAEHLATEGMERDKILTRLCLRPTRCTDTAGGEDGGVASHCA